MNPFVPETATGRKICELLDAHWVCEYSRREEWQNPGGYFITLKTLKEKGYSPFGYRYWLLTADYQKQLTTWEAQSGAQTALRKLYALFVEYGKEIGRADKEITRRNFTHSSIAT